jgi:multisubunit Na+/H+ antiporter MnhE subunit
MQPWTVLTIAYVAIGLLAAVVACRVMRRPLGLDTWIAWTLVAVLSIAAWWVVALILVLVWRESAARRKRERLRGSRSSVFRAVPRMRGD